MAPKALRMKEVREHAAAKLQALISETRNELRALRARAGAQDLKGVRAIRTARQTLARLLTRARELTSITR